MARPKRRNSSTSHSPRPRRSEKEKALAKAMLQRLRGGEDVRARKARRLRGAVRAKHYENDLKLQIALERLIAEL